MKGRWKNINKTWRKFATELRLLILSKVQGHVKWHILIPRTSSTKELKWVSSSRDFLNLCSLAGQWLTFWPLQPHLLSKLHHHWKDKTSAKYNEASYHQKLMTSRCQFISAFFRITPSINPTKLVWLTTSFTEWYHISDLLCKEWVLFSLFYVVIFAVKPW